MTKLKREHILYHYSRYFGEPENMVILENPKLPSVAEFAPSSPTRGWTYATVGMSLKPLPYPSDWSGEKRDRRVEIYIRSTEQNVELFSALLDFFKHMVDKKDFLDYGYLARRKNEVNIVKNSPMTEVVLLPPLAEPEKFGGFRVDDEIVRMLWVIPIHKGEMSFMQQNDWQALVDLFYSKRPNTSDFMRSSII